MGVSRKQSWKRDDGTRMKGDYRYYQCQSKGNKGTCSYHTWRTSKLEDRVLELVRNLEESGELMKSVLGKRGDDKSLEGVLHGFEEEESETTKLKPKALNWFVIDDEKINHLG